MDRGEGERSHGRFGGISAPSIGHQIFRRPSRLEILFQAPSALGRAMPCGGAQTRRASRMFGSPNLPRPRLGLVLSLMMTFLGADERAAPAAVDRWPSLFCYSPLRRRACYTRGRWNSLSVWRREGAFRTTRRRLHRQQTPPTITRDRRARRSRHCKTLESDTKRYHPSLNDSRHNSDGLVDFHHHAKPFPLAYNRTTRSISTPNHPLMQSPRNASTDFRKENTSMRFGSGGVRKG